MNNKSKKQIAKGLAANGLQLTKLSRLVNTKLKTALDDGQELGPDDVSKIVTEVLMPAAEQIAQAGAAIVEGIPGGETSIMDGINNDDGITDDDEEEDNSTPDIVETTNDDNSDHEEDDKSRIAKLEASNKILVARDEATQKSELAKKYGNVFAYKREAAEKEIIDSNAPLSELKTRVATAIQTHATFNEAGLLKQSNYAPRTAKMRTAKSGESLPWSVKI